jgi:hypothetical protein
MSKQPKYFSGEVTCDYSETRIVAAKSPADARRKLEDGQYVAVLGQQIEGVRVVDSVWPTTPDELRHLGGLPKIERIKRKK